MRLSGLLYLYGRRLRTRPVQELLAGVGIAIGVALVFAVQVANSSITDASSAIIRGIAGSASLQVRAREASGFPESVLTRVESLPGVSNAAPILDDDATLHRPGSRRVTIDLASAAPSLLALGGDITHSLSLHNLSTPGVILPSATAHALGLPASVQSLSGARLPHVTLEVRGRASSVAVLAVLGQETIGALSGSMVAIAPLGWVQQITGLYGRITRILVTTKPGEGAAVRRELVALADGRLTVSSADQEISLLKQALTPNTKATGFFVLVSAIVGLLLAFNAMLLTVPERRRVIADLRMQGVRPWQLAWMLLFQAGCLGVVASLAGLAIGDLLSRTVFHATPTYLAAAFPLGSQTVIGTRALLLSFFGGVLATCLAAAPPLLDLHRGRAVDAVYFEEGEPGQAVDGGAGLRLLAVAGALVLATSGPLLLWPSTIVLATVGLALATLLTIPFGFQLAMRLCERIGASTSRLNMLTVAVRALRATTVRSLALAATGAIAVFGCVVAEDAHNDLLHGLYRDYSEYVSTADLWVLNGNDALGTFSFPPGGLAARLASVPGVSGVRPYRGGFLDYAGRRIWVIARASNAPAPIPASQLQEGNLALATARLREGGWIVVSQQIAQAQHARVGDMLKVPTPSGPAAFRIAATTTNLGWTGGAMILDGADYARAWATSDVTAFEVDVRPGARLATVRRELRSLLGPGAALDAQSNGERAAQADALAREGLSRMSQITLMLMIAAALAMAAAIGAGIWQRRSSLAALRIHSFSPWQLRGVLAFESILVLGTGGLAGALAGTYGHLLCDRYLRLTTGFPAPFAFEGTHTIQTILLIVIAALTVLAIPGYIASQAPPQLALQD